MVNAKRKKRIRDLPRSKRPREKLSTVGVENLTAVELLAIILGSGTKRTNVINLAKKILKKFPPKELIHVKTLDLISIKGIGKVQAGKILASLELGRRAMGESPGKRLLVPEDAVREVDEIRIKSREYLIALYLNARYELIKKQVITIGRLNKNLVEARDVFGPALVNLCAFVILVHNHPSNDPTPSKDDKIFTKHIIKAGGLLGITLTDHIIVSKKDYFSFREAKLL